jgi:nucleotide-binding universal stress UspA family protein
MFKNILLPTDGTEYSERAIARCIEFARSIGAKVTGFHAEREYPLLAYGAYAEVGDVDTAPPSHEDYDKGEEILAKRSLASIDAAAKAAGVPCECLCRRARHPWEVIVKAAEEKGCDLIFMAAHGENGRARPLVATETTRVLTHTKIPVLVHR